MRFLKTLNLLHRRTKSDTFVSGSSLESDSEPPNRRSSVPVSLFDLVTSQIPANFKHLSDRGSGSSASVALPVFGSEKELNARLKDANNRWAKEYAHLQCQLKECREELRTERKNAECLQHKLEEDNKIILDLRTSLRHLERLLGVSNHATPGLSQDRLESTASGGTGMLLNVSAMSNVVKGSFANVVGIRTMDEYSSALRMTLATRKELRDQKKVALFWKQKALDGNQFHSTIAPSVSTISSVHDPLPMDRQIALDALISRRGLDSMLGGRMEWKDIVPSRTLIPKLSTYQPADEIGDPIAITRPSIMSSEISRSSRLGPLASESIKAEISSLFGSPDSVKHSTSQKRCEPSHSSSLIGRLTKFTFATSNPPKKTELTRNVESFGDLHTIFATTFGVDELLVDESNGALHGIDVEDDISIPIATILPPSNSVSVPLGPPTGSIFKSSNIPTRRGVVTYAGSQNGVTANTFKQASKDCTSRRPWQSHKARPATSTKGKTVQEGSVSPKRAPGLQKLGRGKENSLARAIPILRRKNIIQPDAE